MNIDTARYTSGRIALANLSASIEGLERRRVEHVRVEDLAGLSELLFLRGDLLGRISDHDRAEAVAVKAAEHFPGDATAILGLARVAERFHRFEEAHALLNQASFAGTPVTQVMGTRAALLQATGRYAEALATRELLARNDPGLPTFGALATLAAEMGDWAKAERLYVDALEVDDGVSPLPVAQLLFEWGVGAMRKGELGRAEEIFAQLETILPAHVPGRGHRAEVAVALGQVEKASDLIETLPAVSDDPEYLATHAEILATRGDHDAAANQAKRAGTAYESLLARRPEAYADHAAFFFMGVGNQPQRAVELAEMNRALRDTPRSRALLSKARRAAAEHARPRGLQ